MSEPNYTLETHLQHRIECLEAEVRRSRQHLQGVADAILEGRDRKFLVNLANDIIKQLNR